ncbi:bacteriocin [Limosilactobacillus reuteri]|uniref:Bacteriocin n=1 Tax=Limosilactobacillus reuteri TaxID=1598 RepID=A0A1C2G7X6_LIMRT|nr:Blp family class II bacteriocin [Limosilactobacillus reuteri]OCW62333.1 bacteriocin [Limosilactobacillus reuteri]OCW66451.1 bacteriocin [Limosilactobacillus reuteri]OCW66941.1 bacteriocin [Limosilactobacillus reuteri]OCW68362.1 bacteriocin [Limosilactobacillus reuteri]OCW71455.1 bacteriocin [Limosilactobacillus reuteri]
MKKIEQNQLKQIIGGNKWGDATIGAMEGAAMGIKVCRPAGPWAMAGCGIVGAGVKGYLNYHG